MTITMLQQAVREEEAEFRLRREDFPQIPAEAPHLIREGWEDLDQAVDMLTEKASFGFAALLEAPIAFLAAATKN